MDLPYEILMKILSYLPNYDILRRVPVVSKKFHQISQDQHNLRKIDFEFKDSRYVRNWSEERKEKYYRDFLEVVEKSHQLKFLSFTFSTKNADADEKWVPRPERLFYFLGNLLSFGGITHEHLEEFSLTTNSQKVTQYDSHTRLEYFIEDVFRYLDKCPKLKIIKLEKIKLDRELISQNKFRSFEGLKKAEFKTLQEFHITLFGRFDIVSVKSLLEIISEKPSIQRIFLTVTNPNDISDAFCQVFQEIELKNKVKIKVKWQGIDVITIT